MITTTLLHLFLFSFLLRSITSFLPFLPLPPTRTKRKAFLQQQQHITKKDNVEADNKYYSSPEQQQQLNLPTAQQLISSCPIRGEQRVTLTRYLNCIVQEQPELREKESILLSVQMACKTISNMINRAGLNQLSTPPSSSSTTTTAPIITDVRYNSMKQLDELSTNVLRNALRFTGTMAMIKPAPRDSEIGPAEHQPGVLIAKGLDSKYVAFFDPLDGSGNADAGILTGTIFGIFDAEDTSSGEKEEEEEEEGDNTEDELIRNVLQPGRNLRAAGYCLYSSATILVFSIGDGTHGFTLDPQVNEFVLTHPNIRIPPRGNIYSCNESNSIGWSSWLQTYLKSLKSATNMTQKRYAHRYIGSFVGDIHRTLLYGGIFWYPEDTVGHPNGNLQLLYKVMPLSYLVCQAGGLSTNGWRSVLEVRPRSVHERSPCFMGSWEDVEEMMSYVVHEEVEEEDV